MTILDLPDDGSREREVFLLYGLAMHHAQMFERSMINLSLLLDLSPETHTRADYDDLEVVLSKKTAGALIKRIQDKVNLDETTIDLLEKALEDRNFLAHRFFYAHAVDFMFDEGKQSMVDFCEATRMRFKKADLILTTLQQIIMDLLGVKQSTIDEMEASLINEWTARRQ